MKKPTPKAQPALDFSECTDYIEQKYGIATRDYANSHIQFHEWRRAKGYGDIDSEGNLAGSSKIWYSEFQQAIKAGEVVKRPYQDFWHWLVDTVCPTNGGTFLLDKEFGDCAEPWQVEILGFYLDEFGKGPYRAEW